jgi:alpha-methylacyl-CoA racemase
MISIDMKSKEGVDIIKKMCATSDVLLDTFRPGVLEKLGLGPDLLTKSNPCLIYARLTGYGQSGPYKNKAGHDINYVAMSGVLSMLARNGEPPVPPINLLADFAGGSVVCCLGIILALFERTKSGKGQIVDAAMADGLSYIASWLFRSRNLPIWQGEPGTNILDGGFAAYGTYKTKDGKFMAVGALEPKFYNNFLKGLQLSEDEYGQYSNTDVCKKKFTETFLQKTQDEWCQIFDSLDACVTPVLDIESLENNDYYKNKIPIQKDNNNMIVPEPSPRLSRTPGLSVGVKPQSMPGQHTIQVLKELGYNKSKIDKLIQNGSVYANNKSNL